MIVFFIPGLLCTEEVWGDLNLIRKKYQCYDADVSHFDSIEKIADNCIKNIPNEDVVIIGISMGGYVAIDIAVKLGNRIKKLILINTTSNSVNLETLSEREEAIKLAEKGKMKEIVNMSKGFCFFNPKDEWLFLEEKMANQIGCEAYIKQQKAIISRKDNSNEISKIMANSLIIAGKNDNVISYEKSLYLFRNIPKANLIILDECGHLSTIEKSTEVYNYITTFMGSGNEYNDLSKNAMF
ncbi:MAG: alpha/beta hydrolase [Tatlockia sp.]|nr:alpha/beta hydrolase [Tatlockia sp.]